jgi:hypothetical protein
MPASPWDPGEFYTLSWEFLSDRTVPGKAPPDWAAEYDPKLLRDGEPQVRVAGLGTGEPVRCGGYSVRFQLHQDDPVINNGTRAELAAADFEPADAERWYGFSIYLPEMWVCDQSAEIVTQWHQHWTIGTSPPLAIQTRKGQWEISQNWEGPHYSDTPVGAYETGRWTDWVVHVKWSAGNAGVLDIWKNAQPVPGFSQKLGKNTYNDPNRGNYLKFGIYKWDWSQNNPSDTTKRVMFYDELRIADQRGSYQAVGAPLGTQWCGG